MGHLVNPVAWRLGKNIYWKSLYYINNLDFAYNNINDINLFIFLNKFFKNKFLKFSNLSISNFKILKFFSGTFVYALFRSHNYGSKGLYKYSRKIFLSKLLYKKVIKKKISYSRKTHKKSILPKIKHNKPIDSKKYKYMSRNFSKKVDIINFLSCRVEKFRKAIRRNKFIFKKFNRKARRYPKMNYFLNYCFYISNFKKNLGHIHKRAAEHYAVSAALRRLKRFFLVKFSKKGSRRNSVFNNYFFKNPRRYFKNKSYFSRSGKGALKTSSNSEDVIPYNYRKFFVFNILKLFPKNFLSISNRYSSLSKGYIFVRNRLKFKAGFYNNFLHIYRKFPTFIFIKNFLSSFVNKFFSRIKFTFIFCSEKFISANLIRDFVLIKMSQKFKLGKIAFMALRLLGDLCRKNIIKGFRVLMAGRFSRKDRATFYWKRGGFLSFNDRMSALDYSFGTKVLRYSLCVCKIWINN